MSSPQQATDEYIESVNLKANLNDVVNKLITEKPEDAYQFLVKEFTKLSNTVIETPDAAQVIIQRATKSAGRRTRGYSAYEDERKYAPPNLQTSTIDGSTTNAALLRTPQLNKGLGFTPSERRDLQLHGLLPPVCASQEAQEGRVMWNLNRKHDDLDKYAYLMGVLDANEKLFYSTVLNNIKQCMPIVYTPIVGKACVEFGHIWNRPRGMYITIKDLGNVRKMLDNWHQPTVKAIVFTDGQRILGLGDLGAFGMGIPIGKLSLYTACAGVAPEFCLPVMIDVGTNNETLLEDPMYTGLNQKRDSSEKYDELITEFLDAATDKFGKTCILQFEDFGNANAFRLLAKHRNNYCTFNDDVQGTASVTLAGIFSCMRASKTTFKDHKFLFFGAGSAGLGIANLVALAISQELKITLAEGRKYVWLCDSRGLIVADRPSGGLNAEKMDFAHPCERNDLKDLHEIVSFLKPTGIIGVSAQAGVFTEDVCREMAAHCAAPIIFPLSNPTVKAECSAETAINATEGRCLFASGSPFDEVTYKGKTYVPGQGNNAFIFPGLALGALAVGALRFPDELFMCAAKSLAAVVTEDNLARHNMYPNIKDIRSVSLKIAVDVANRAYELGVATRDPRPENMEEAVRAEIWDERYSACVKE
jgi:malate dehydrogenase (oxaloacetate-decarboxylating)(NADP+)